VLRLQAEKHMDLEDRIFVIPQGLSTV